MTTIEVDYVVADLILTIFQYSLAFGLILLFVFVAFYRFKKWMSKQPKKYKRKTAHDWVFGNNEENPNKVIEKSEN